MNAPLSPKFYANLYALASLLIAVTLFFSYAPLNNAHEGQHFLRGLTFSALYKDGTLPISIIEFTDVTTENNFLARRINNTNAKRDLNFRAQDIFLDSTKRQPYVSDKKVVRYPAIDYIPQIIAGSLGQAFDLKPVSIYYLARLLCLSLGIVFGFLILRLLPVYHVQIMVLLLLPTFWIIEIQQYPDYVVTIAACLYFVLLIRAFYTKRTLDWRQGMGFTAVGTVLAISKVVYFPLIFTILLISPNKFASSQRRAWFVSAVIGFCFLATLVNVHHVLNETYSFNILSPNIVTSSNPQKALLLVMQQPYLVAKDLGQLILKENFWRQLITSLFIWKMAPLAMFEPFGVLPFLMIALPFILVFENTISSQSSVSNTKTGSKRLTARQNIGGNVLLILVVMATAIFILLSIYIDEYPITPMIQGRYFIPILPYTTLLFSRDWSQVWQRRGALYELIISLSLLAVVYVSLSVQHYTR